MALKTLWRSLNKPSGPEVGPYGYLTNQLGHYVIGAALFQILGIYYLIAVVLYLLLWELYRWNGVDSLVDTAFILLGPLPAYVVLPLALLIVWLTNKDN